jgi:hypothetical protein
MELSDTQLSQLMKRFPEFELSYETISHKKVSPQYNVCLAIPTGKKCFAWYTFHEDKDVCYVFDLNREKKISKSTMVNTLFDRSLALGTIVYGTFIKEESTNHQWFIVEDILFYKGIPMKKTCFEDKLHFLEQYMENIQQSFPTPEHIVFILPIMWEVSLTEQMVEYPPIIPENISPTIYYQVHHIQYRSGGDIMPYLNVNIGRKLNMVSIPSEPKKRTSHQFDTMYLNMDYSKPQYKYPTVFQVTADIQFDIYHLFAYGKNNKPVYYNTAYIPNYKSSVFMNGLFRNIRENKNLDYIEESDDEEDFQNMAEDKYVNIDKVLVMEFKFNSKFKRWTPVKVVDKNSKIVHVNKLVR